MNQMVPEYWIEGQDIDLFCVDIQTFRFQTLSVLEVSRKPE